MTAGRFCTPTGYSSITIIINIYCVSAARKHRKILLILLLILTATTSNCKLISLASFLRLISTVMGGNVLLPLAMEALTASHRTRAPTPSLCVCVCVCAFASLSLLGPTCVPDAHYQDLSPYWDLIWDPIEFFIDFDSLTRSNSSFYIYWVFTSCVLCM